MAVLHGGDTPFLLRPKGKLGEYKLIGKYFIYRIIEAEALAWKHAVTACNKLQDDQGRCPDTEAIRWRVTAGILSLCRK